MITRFRISNFKKLGDVELEFGNSCVFIGPNNSGKTSALQALALWDIGCKRWSEKRERSSPSQRKGVTINRRDLYAIPVPSAKLLWSDLHTHFQNKESQKTETVNIVLVAEGVHRDRPWVCALEFYYANEESFYCRLVNSDDGQIPEGARAPIVFLPPMSGLAEREHRKEAGEINVLIGEGQTAQVLRNLCWQLYCLEDKTRWNDLTRHLKALFHIELQEPVYIRERSELTLTYKERSGVELDLSSSGRGCQQILLLVAFMLGNPRAVLLLDEPDAHLEILRQRDVYNLLGLIAHETSSQIVAASHSEIILEEASERDVVMAFVGKPHRIDTRGRSQVKKALESIRISDYYVAEQKGWMLYLEGSTDLEILRCLAARLEHPSAQALSESVPVFYLSNNQPQDARNHFQGLREAKPDLVGIAIFDRLDRELHAGSKLVERMWSRREIENFIVTRESIIAYISEGVSKDDLFGRDELLTREGAMRASMSELEQALDVARRPNPWGDEIKVTDEFLDPLFEIYYQKLGIPQRTYKRDYHELARVIPIDQIGQEVREMLDVIHQVACSATPSG